jgi:Zn-dependent M28 family amino/carboxypeptidase
LLVPAAVLDAQQAPAPLASITEAELRDHIFFLASDFLEGRDAHEQGYMLAAEYGAIHFAAAGLQPMFTDSTGRPSLLQQVPFENATITAASVMRVTVDGVETVYQLGEEFAAQQVFATGNAPIVGTPVFLGYGIEEPELGWNDYEGLDVTGKIAVVVAGAPTRNGQPVLPEEQHQRYSSLLRSGQSIFMPALNRGAAALIIVPDSAFMPMWARIAEAYSRPSVRLVSSDTAPGDPAALAWAIPLKPEAAASMLSGTGLDPLSGTGTYTPGPLEGVTVSLEMQFEAEPAYTSPNVVGVLPGTDSLLKDEYVVVTAHLDHVGVRGGEVYNGADDNASGSAAIIEAAEAAGMAPGKRSIIFVLLTSEEDGLLGANYFADNPPVPIEQIVLNINLDMVGRNSPDFPEVLLAMGSEQRRPELLQLIRDVNVEVGAPLDWRLNEGPDPHNHVQRSDQMAFMQKGIPAILITRGFMGPDYHQASDDAATINYPKVVYAARLAYGLALEAANRDVLFNPE